MTKQTSRHKAFTLVELLVVIVIMALLAAALLSNYSRIREEGWATQCKANLKSLYQAALNYSTDNGGNFPLAGPFETYDPLSQTYTEHKAWVNWTGIGTWPQGPNPQMVQPVWFGGAAQISITNGTLWDYTSHDMNAYLCPKFRTLARSKYASSDPHYNVVRGYVMNSLFGCANQQNGLSLAGLSQEASRTLMFADMQNQSKYLGNNSLQVCSYYAGHGDTTANTSQNGDDAVLSATNAPSGLVTTESIGYIHSMAGEYRGHAVFMDGHVAAIGLYYDDQGNALSAPSNCTYAACTGQY